MKKLKVVQDGSTFYFRFRSAVTAPRRVYSGKPHDTLAAADDCRKWFISDYCERNDISPIFE